MLVGSVTRGTTGIYSIAFGIANQINQYYNTTRGYSTPAPSPSRSAIVCATAFFNPAGPANVGIAGIWVHLRSPMGPGVDQVYQVKGKLDKDFAFLLRQPGTSQLMPTETLNAWVEFFLRCVRLAIPCIFHNVTWELTNWASGGGQERCSTDLNVRTPLLCSTRMYTLHL
jgi:hypothetical protein